RELPAAPRFVAILIAAYLTAATPSKQSREHSLALGWSVSITVGTIRWIAIVVHRGRIRVRDVGAVGPSFCFKERCEEGLAKTDWQRIRCGNRVVRIVDEYHLHLAILDYLIEKSLEQFRSGDSDFVRIEDAFHLGKLDFGFGSYSWARNRL